MLQSSPWRPDYWPFRISNEAGALLRRVARVWLIVATVVFVVMGLRGGIPEPMDPGSWETTAQLASFALVVIGELLAWKWPAIGASLITIGAVALGVLAAIEYSPTRALAVTLVFCVPAFLYWLDWQRRQPILTITVLALVLAAMLGMGAVLASEVYDAYNRPTHPGSQTPAPPVTLVRWLWSGALTPGSIEVRAAVTRDTHAVFLVVSETPDLASPLTFGPTSAVERVNNRVVTLRARELNPGTDYYYAISANGELDRARIGRFTTPEHGPFSFTFATGACARTGSNGMVFDTIRGANPLFYLVPGDLFYENIDENDPARFRDAFEDVLTSPAQAALYQTTPIVYTWDDHDFGPDDSDRTSPSREAARQVYAEAVPHFNLGEREASGPIYQAFSIGRVRFILTDGRSAKTPRDQPDGPDKTMLGAEQKQWFKRELLAARDDAGLIVWVSSLPWIGKASEGADYWAGYATERQELADFIADNQITNLLMIAGDAHMLAIDDGTHSDYSTAQAGGFPVFHAGALDRRGSVKGGPYSEGTHPGGGHFGLVTITDVGGPSITVTLSGRDYKNNELVAHTFTVSTANSSSPPTP